ncbi:BTB/POZ and MATH domain-containing protein 1-like [Lolium rigidum]|uniref:BTB/POZ and MATH domain-containing protein 1-like n=1 Tax=Lolium rigidum TaxID=89674 RepID=UPI001F5D24D2|nr:BTB/POZ and MATH domain-containing protein 1-like [Lolium rigidum]
MAAPSPSPSVSGSTCTPETARGTHLFKIDGYSLYMGLGVGKSVESTTFAVGGYDWRICFYPDGDEESSKDYVSLYLQLLTMDAEARALYDLRLVDQVRTAPAFTWSKSSHDEEPRVFKSGEDGFGTWGYTKLMRKSELQASPYILNDALVVECNLSVIKLMPPHEESDVKLYSITPKVPPSELVDNLSRLLEATEGADVSFNVKNEVFPAHKIILAMRSPVFWVDFYGPMRDESRRIITVEDMQPAVFRGLLHFIYTDSLPPLDDLYDDDDDDDDEYDEMLRHLLVAADRYGIERMKLMCERKLCQNLYAGTVATTLALADQHHCSQLKDACIEFINSSDRMDDVVETQGYKNLKRECPAIFADLWEKAAKTHKI